MALGSNIEYKSRALFQAALDEKSAQKLESRFTELSKKAAEMSREEFVKSFSSLGQEINKALSKLSLQPIDMEKLLQLPQAEVFSQFGAEFGARFAEGFQGAVAGGGIDVGKQLEGLVLEQERLVNKRNSLQKGMGRVDYLSELPELASLDEVRPFSSEQIKTFGKTVDEAALKIQDDFTRAEDRLSETTRGTIEYQQALINAYEAASNLYRMQGYINQNPGKIQDRTIISDYDNVNLADITNDLFENYHRDLRNVGNTFYEPELAKVSTRLQEIDGQIKQIQQNNPDIINQQSVGMGLKTLNEIEAAYQRILNSHGKIGKQGTNIQSALNFDPSTSKQGIQALYDAYTKMPDGSPWEVEYQALLKYVRLYESYLTSENATHRKKTENPQFKALYDQLKPMAENAQNMLQNVLNMANKTPMVGMGDTGSEKSAESSQKAAIETQKKAEAETKARTEAETKTKADAESAASAEKERLAQEAGAKAAQQAAVAAEQERASKEATVKATKEASSSYTTGGILDNPMFANMFGKANDEAEKKHVANEGAAKAAQEELGAVQKTTAELEKQQKLLLYRRVEGQVDLNRISNRSGDALYNKQGQPIIQDALAMGYGGYGDGLYSSVFSSAKNLIPETPDGPVSFFEFDASAYNLYINKTVEQAEALRTFLLSLQKLVGGGTLLDTSELTHIADLSEDQLFEKAQQIFKNFSMTKEQFHTWLENAKIEAEKIAGLFAKGEAPADRHNFGTRFMKTLGYEGVLNQTGDMEYDGNTQGSVIYDPNTDDIKQNARVFQNEQEFAAYIKAEAQAHQENTAAINAEAQAQEHLNQAENQNPPAQDDTGTHNANARAIQNETQSQEQLNGAETQEPPPIDDTPQIQGENGALDEQNAKLKENINLKTQANGQGSSKSAIQGSWMMALLKQQYSNSGALARSRDISSFSDDNIRYLLESFGATGLRGKQTLSKTGITGQDIIQGLPSLVHSESLMKAFKFLEGDVYKLGDIFVDYYNEVITYKEAFARIQTVMNERLTKLSQMNVVPQENKNQIGETRTKTGMISDKTIPTQTVPDGATSAEATELEAVRAKVLEVTNAINMKNKAFYNEGQIVSQAVGKENAALISLKSNIDAITSAVNTKTQAFVREEMTVRQSVGKENAALISLQGNVNNVATSLGGTLSNLQGVRMPNLSNATSQTNITNEAQALANLRTRIDEVTAAVRTKTTSFVQEEMAVRQSVGNEITALIRLMQNVNNVNTAIGNLTTGLNTALNNAGAFNGINLNVNATVDLATIETTLANILTAIPNAGTNVQNNNAGAQGNAGGGTGGRAGDLAGRITVQASMLDNFEAKLMDIGQLTPNVQNQINQLRTALNNVADAPGLTAWMNQFRTMRTDMNTAGIISDLDTLGQMATTLGQLRAKSSQAATSEERAGYDALIQQIEAVIQHMQQGAGVDSDWLDNRALEAYNKSMEKYRENLVKTRAEENRRDRKQTFNDAIKQSQKNARVKKSDTVATRAEDAYEKASSIDGLSQDQINRLQEYKAKVDSLRASVTDASGKKIVSDQQAAQLKTQTAEVDAYTKEIQELIANYERLSGPNAESLGATSTLGLGASAEAYKQELTSAVQAATKGRAQIKAYDAETRTLTYTLKTGKGEFTQYTASVRQADGALMTVRGTTTKAMGVFEALGNKIKQYSYYLTGSMMIMRAISWVREGVTAVKEIDTALTELKKVTDETEESYDRFLNTAAKTAEKVGSTIKDVVSSTADWARLNKLGLLYGDM